MSKSPLEVLQPSLEKLPTAQRAVFESLSPAELGLAVKLQERLASVEPEVSGQNNLNNCLC